MHVSRLRTVLLIGSAAVSLGLSQTAAAQVAPQSTAPADPPAAADTPVQQSSEIPSDDAGGLSDVVVTATKRGQAQNVQDVPFAVTAFGSDQLDEQHVRSIAGLSYDIRGIL